MRAISLREKARNAAFSMAVTVIRPVILSHGINRCSGLALNAMDRLLRKSLKKASRYSAQIAVIKKKHRRKEGRAGALPSLILRKIRAQDETFSFGIRSNMLYSIACILLLFCKIIV